MSVLRSVRACGAVLLLLLGTAKVEAQPAQDSVPAASRYAATAAMLARFVVREMADKNLPALSIALVEDQQVVWARGFGWANPRDSVPATARTVYRVGSVSKLFTDIGVMQLVEQGRLDLDVPVTRYLSGFRPLGTTTAITLRQLMSHRAGLVREPPVGHYFDNTAPSLAATVASLTTRASCIHRGRDRSTRMPVSPSRVTCSKRSDASGFQRTWRAPCSPR